MTGLKAMNTPASSARQRYATPPALFREIERRFGGDGFTLDVCAEPWSAKCARYFDEDMNGLAQDWRVLNDSAEWEPARAFCNPPFDSIEDWVTKGWNEVVAGNAELACFLLPPRLDQPWFHEVVRPHASVVHFLRGRVQFCPPPELGVKAKPSGNFEGSMVVVFQGPIVASRFR